MPPTAGAPGQYQQYQGYPPQGYPSYPPPKSSSSGTPRGGCSSASAWRSPWAA